MDKLIDEILAIYRRIDKGEVCEEMEARKKIKRKLEKFEYDVRLQTMGDIADFLEKLNGGKSVPHIFVNRKEAK